MPAAQTQPVRGTGGLVRQTSVKLPVVNVRVPLLSPRLPGVGAVAAQTRWAAQAMRTNLPPTERLLYYGGLGLMAGVGAVEWPVAVAVGAGVWVAGRTGERRSRQDAPA